MNGISLQKVTLKFNDNEKVTTVASLHEIERQTRHIYYWHTQICRVGRGKFIVLCFQCLA